MSNSNTVCILIRVELRKIILCVLRSNFCIPSTFFQKSITEKKSPTMRSEFFIYFLFAHMHEVNTK